MYHNPYQTIAPRQSRHMAVVPGQKPKQDKGRVCRAEGCDTQLSRYNPSDSCRVHDGWRDARMRRQG